MDEHLLVRRWSADALFGPGAQSDEILTFHADGTGYFEQLNWGYGLVIAFDWSLVSGILTIEKRGEFETAADGQLGSVTSTAAVEKYQTADALITDEVLPVLGRSQVLRLPGFARIFMGIETDVAFGHDPAIR